MAYTVPQVKVHQEFAATPAAVANPLRAFVVGPHFNVVTQSKLGQYNPLSDAAYNWPGRPAGGVVDQTFTSVTVKDALLKYYSNASGGADDISAVHYKPNRIRANSVVFKTANGYDRSAGFYDRDVKVGDIAHVYANVDGTTYHLWSRIVDLVPDLSSTSIDTSPASDVDNSGGVSGGNPAVSNTGTGGGSRSIGSNAIGATTASTYNGLASGHVTETYTIEVTTASVSGVGGLAKVTSASGTDDAVDVALTASGQTIGTRGTTFNWSGSGEWNVGDKFVLTCRTHYVVPTVTAGGSFVSNSNTTYIVEVTKGGTSTSAEISISTTNGIDISGPHIVTELSDVAIGSKGVTVNFNEPGGTLKLIKGEKWYIACTGKTEQAYRTLVLADNLPAELQAVGQNLNSSSAFFGADLNLELYVKKTISLPSDRVTNPPNTNWDQGTTQITLKSGVTVYDSEFLDNSGNKRVLTLGADSGGLWSIVYVTYRSLLQTYATSIHSLTNIDDVESTLGPVTTDNPLALGVWYALRNSAGAEVLFMAVPTNDNAGYSTALDKASLRDDVYTIVPLTRDATIQNTVAGHVANMSAPEVNKWRITFLNGLSSSVDPLLDLGEVYPLGGTTEYTEDDLVATVTDDPDASGTQYTLVDWTPPFGGGFNDLGVRAGDIFRINYAGDGFGNSSYDEYVVDSVVSNQRLKLLSGPSAAINVARKFSIQRSLTKDEEAALYGTKAASFASRRVFYVWPDVIEDGAGIQIPGYFACAALAGLVSGVVPQQGLTNVEIGGFSEVSRTTQYFSSDQLNTMAESGVWILAQEPTTGVIYSRHELSTLGTDVNTRELMVTKNVDSISYTFYNQLKPYIGRANVQPRLFVLLRRQIFGSIDYLKSQGVTPNLGPQLISAEITELRAHSVNPDQVVINIALTIPYPLNVIDLTLVA